MASEVIEVAATVTARSARELISPNNNNHNNNDDNKSAA